MWRRAVTVGVIAVFALVATGQASAEPIPESGSPLSFADASEVSTSCAALAQTPVKVPIANETGVAQEVAIRLDLADEDGKAIEATEVCGGLTLGPKPASLPPGGSAVMELGALNGEASGGFSGSIVLYAKEGRVARKKLVVAPAPASGERELNVVPVTPSVNATFEDTKGGTIWVGVEPQEPSAAEDGHGTEKVTLGALSGPGGPVAVVYDGKGGSVAPGLAKVGLDLEGGLKPGTYSGEVDLAPKDKEKGVVKLEVKVSKTVWLAVALLFIGIVLGIGLLRAAGRMVPASRLEARVEALEDRHRKAREALRKGQTAAAGWEEIRIGNLGELQNKLLRQIAEAKKKAFVKIEPKAIENIETAIQLVEAQVDLLEEIPKHAQAVEKALQLPKAVELPQLMDTHNLERPKLESGAEKVIAGGSIDAEDVKPRIEEMDSAAKQVRELRVLEATLEELWLASKLLEGDTNPLISKLEDCRDRLWILDDAAGLALAGEKIQAAREKLVELRADQGHPSQLPTLPFPPQRLGTGGLSADYVAFANVGSPAGEEGEGAPLPVAVTVVETPEPQLSIPDLPPPALEQEKVAGALNRAFLVQVLVVLASAAIALATGLGALYAGKTWGTFWDCLAAVVWGLAAQATVSVLATSLDELTSLNWFQRG